MPGGCHGGWASHSQGCSVHSSHRLPWGLPLSAAVGCLPTMKERGKGIKKTHQWNPLHISWDWILNREDFSLFVMFLLSLTVTRKKKWKVHGNNSIGELFFVLFEPVWLDKGLQMLQSCGTCWCWADAKQAYYVQDLHLIGTRESIWSNAEFFCGDTHMMCNILSSCFPTFNSSWNPINPIISMLAY